MAIKTTSANTLLTAWKASGEINYCFLLDASGNVIDTFGKPVSWGTPSGGSLDITADIVWNVPSGVKPSKIVLANEYDANLPTGEAIDEISITVDTYPTAGTYTLQSFLITVV